MKRLMIILFALILGISVNAQKYFYEAADDTVKYDTNTYPSATSYIKVTKASGLISFTFTHTDVADSLSFARLEGSDDGSTWVALTGNAALSNTTTDGQSKIYTSNPLIYLYYRSRIACAATDSVAVTDPILMYKEE